MSKKTRKVKKKDKPWWYGLTAPAITPADVFLRIGDHIQLHEDRIRRLLRDVKKQEPQDWLLY